MTATISPALSATRASEENGAWYAGSISRESSKRSTTSTRNAVLAPAVAVFLLAITGAARTSSGDADGPGREVPIAFTQASLEPMDRERVVPDQTVVVEDGRIVAIGPSHSTPPPGKAVIIGGDGKVVGHEPPSVGLDHAVRAGQLSIEHMDGIPQAAATLPSGGWAAGRSR
jgi:hypothetical protein